MTVTDLKLLLRLTFLKVDAHFQSGKGEDNGIRWKCHDCLANVFGSDSLLKPLLREYRDKIQENGGNDASFEVSNNDLTANSEAFDSLMTKSDFGWRAVSTPGDSPFFHNFQYRGLREQLLTRKLKLETDHLYSHCHADLGLQFQTCIFRDIEDIVWALLALTNVMWGVSPRKKKLPILRHWMS